MEVQTWDKYAVGYRAVSNHRQATEWGFVIGTAKKFWQNNPFGFRIVAEPPAKAKYDLVGDGPGLVCLLFWQGSVRTVSASFGEYDMTLARLLAGYDFFPSDFRESEVAMLEGQLKDAKIKVGAYALKSVGKTRA